MYNASQNYLDYINNPNNIGRSIQNKIVIDDVEYFSDKLKTNPKISHEATSFIGGFYSKTCDFEILNLDGSLILNNKEIKVYKGEVINGATEWVLMGLFKALDPNIASDKTSKSIKFLGNDRAILFDTAYESNLDWSTSHTGLEIVQESCNKIGVELETTNFAFASYVFTSKPNFLEDTTHREIIGRLAEIGGEIAYISRNGGLKIVGQSETGQTAGKEKRISLTKEPKFGAINTVALGKADIEDDIIYKNQEMIDAAKGKNLFNYINNDLYDNGVDVSLIPSGLRVTATVAGTYKYATFPVGGEEMLGKTYTLSGVFTPSSQNTGAIKAYFLRENGTALSSIKMLTISDMSVTFTVPSTMPEGATSIGLILYANDAGTGNIGDYVDYTEVQLEEGSSRTSYEPFFDGVITWRIEDNPYVDLIREQIIGEVANHIIGMSIIPFNIDGFIDDFIYDLNDVINITENDGTTFKAVLLKYETKNRFRSIVGATTQTEKLVNHDIAGSVKNTINRVSVQVNHNTQQIELLATKTEELEDEIVQSETTVMQNAETIIMEALKDYVTTGDFETFQNTVSTQFAQTNEDFTFTFNNVIQQLNNLDEETQDQFQEISKYIRFVDGKIILGEVGNELTLQIANDKISFLQNDSEVAYFSNNKLYVTDGEFLNSLIIGNFSWKPRANGNLSLVYTGGDN